ncbi:MAG: hypothetical protein EOP45_23380, partial [Sphingobacteriaceae bacterium]
MPSELITAYHEAFVKRIKRMGLDPLKLEASKKDLPVVNITRTNKALETKEPNLSFTLNANDPASTLEKINVWVNDVPLYGSNGLSLKDKQLNKFTQDVSIQLSTGSNKIQVSALNNKGVESLKETLKIAREEL